MGKRYEAVSPVEYQKNGETKTKWVKCGSGFENDQGAITIWLEALPVNGKLVLKVPQPYQGGRGGGQGNPRGPQGGGQQQSYSGGGQQGNPQTGFTDDGRF